jgi:hypothetical protein
MARKPTDEWQQLRLRIQRLEGAVLQAQAGALVGLDAVSQLGEAAGVDMGEVFEKSRDRIQWRQGGLALKPGTLGHAVAQLPQLAELVRIPELAQLAALPAPEGWRESAAGELLRAGGPGVPGPGRWEDDWRGPMTVEPRGPVERAELATRGGTRPAPATVSVSVEDEPGLIPRYGTDAPGMRVYDVFYGTTRLGYVEAVTPKIARHMANDRWPDSKPPGLVVKARKRAPGVRGTRAGDAPRPPPVNPRVKPAAVPAAPVTSGLPLWALVDLDTGAVVVHPFHAGDAGDARTIAAIKLNFTSWKELSENVDRVAIQHVHPSRGECIRSDLHRRCEATGGVGLVTHARPGLHL